MRNLKNTKEEFINGVADRLRDGRWGLDEIEFLNENRKRYSITCDEIGFFLVEAYRYTYAMAMEDGVVTPLEQEELSVINKLYMENLPHKRADREILKAKIFVLTRRFEKTNQIQEQMEKAQNLINRQEEIKSEVSSVYYRKLPTPYPKLTPYTY